MNASALLVPFGDYSPLIIVYKESFQNENDHIHNNNHDVEDADDDHDEADDDVAGWMLFTMLLDDILTENGFLCCKLLLVRCYVISSIQLVTRIASIT